MAEIDLERVLCSVAELEPSGCRGFSVGEGNWPLRGFVVRTTSGVAAYVNRCPHAGHGLNLLPDRFLTPDGSLIVCRSHGALFEKATGLCVAGPCAGRALTPVQVVVLDGYVLLDASVEPTLLADGVIRTDPDRRDG
ncbi:MAG: Rieske 2Fe-2S domain-containing protein [Pseudomonadales bacterium]|jgi:nitrite reductase/ring-hydroxylating ferredoxin subunit|nr:Rieske 2Fe-2S domain-containing protein [Pseudomonadales bacterium]